MTTISTILQVNLPNELRGRVMSIYGLAWELMPVGGMIAGAIAEFAGAPIAVGFGGFMVAGMALTVAMFLPEHAPLGTVAHPVLIRTREHDSNGGEKSQEENRRAAQAAQARRSIHRTHGQRAAGDGVARPRSKIFKRAIDKDGGKVLANYREPFGGQWLVLAALPIDQVEPTPYQRNLSDTHVRKLEGVIAKLGRFLDPIIVVRKESKDSNTRYWTPNGNHRLSAMKTLGAKCIVGIVVPETSAAYQILALNTEKAHNLRERALEVIKMYQELATLDDATEETYALEFEEAALITLGLCYLENGRFSGGAYHPILDAPTSS